jgi:3-oxoacyl-[acyl-carrier-protein] synthase II
VIPPTRNLEHADPACDLDYTPQIARPRAVRRVLKLSLGFGGHLAAAVLRRYEEREPQIRADERR